MFYDGEPEEVLRLGDVVRGYISANPIINEPFVSSPEGYSYKIDIEQPKYCVVLTPCCDIGEGLLSLTPLINVLGAFLKNGYFEEDLTRINRRMTAEQSFASGDWEKLSEDEKQRRNQEGTEYTLLRYFIYAENEILPEYTLRSHVIKYYMINFQNIYTIKCPNIKKDKKMCQIVPKEIIESKVLQLSIEARTELRDKISYYYSRVPEEDMILED